MHKKKTKIILQKEVWNFLCNMFAISDWIKAHAKQGNVKATFQALKFVDFKNSIF